MALEPRSLLERVIRREGPATLDTRIEGPATVGLVSSQRDPFGQTMTSVADPLIEMPDLNTVFDLRGSRASWGNFVDVVDQAPDLLLMFTPVRRRPRGVEGYYVSEPSKPEPADLKATGHSPGSSFGTLRTKAIGT